MKLSLNRAECCTRPEAIFLEEDVPGEYEDDIARNADYYIEGPGYWDYDLDEQRRQNWLGESLTVADFKRIIVGFHQDEQGDWVAELACGHQRHVRHNPPWTNHPWVTTPTGRRSFIGIEIECNYCSEEKSEENN